RDGCSPKGHLIHRIVMEAFCGPAPDGMEVCHNNGNPRDNRLCNLRYDTHKNNHSDQQEHGTSNKGERNGRSRLNEGVVMDIRNRYDRGECRHAIAASIGISETTVRDIATRRSWSHVTQTSKLR